MDDLNLITGLMRENYDAVGFIPDSTIQQRYLAGGRYLIQTDLGGRKVGYMLHGKPTPGGMLTIAQVAIDYDLRLRGHGQDVVARLIQRANNANCRVIKLRVGDDLPANEFWASMGFELCSQVAGGVKRQRLINVYRLDLWPTLFDK